jgi:hypothetical protein
MNAEAVNIETPIDAGDPHQGALFVEGVSVAFDGFKALNDLTLYVEHGELRCLIGPNGAGKTTLIDADAREALLARFEPVFVQAYGALMCRKLGLERADAADADLIDRLLHALHDGRVDYPAFMRRLGAFRPGDPATRAPLLALSRAPDALNAWLDAYATRLTAETVPDAERNARMDTANPLYVLRTHLAERAIRLASDARDYGEIERLRRLLARPFTPQPGAEFYAEPPPDGASDFALSCSS